MTDWWTRIKSSNSLNWRIPLKKINLKKKRKQWQTEGLAPVSWSSIKAAVWLCFSGPCVGPKLACLLLLLLLLLTWETPAYDADAATCPLSTFHLFLSVILLPQWCFSTSKAHLNVLKKTFNYSLVVGKELVCFQTSYNHSNFSTQTQDFQYLNKLSPNNSLEMLFCDRQSTWCTFQRWFQHAEHTITWTFLTQKNHWWQKLFCSHFGKFLHTK